MLQGPVYPIPELNHLTGYGFVKNWKIPDLNGIGNSLVGGDDEMRKLVANTLEASQTTGAARSILLRKECRQYFIDMSVAIFIIVFKDDENQLLLHQLFSRMAANWHLITCWVTRFNANRNRQQQHSPSDKLLQATSVSTSMVVHGCLLVLFPNGQGIFSNEKVRCYIHRVAAYWMFGVEIPEYQPNNIWITAGYAATNKIRKHSEVPAPPNKPKQGFRRRGKSTAIEVTDRDQELAELRETLADIQVQGKFREVKLMKNTQAVNRSPSEDTQSNTSEHNWLISPTQRDAVRASAWYEPDMIFPKMQKPELWFLSKQSPLISLFLSEHSIMHPNVEQLGVSSRLRAGMRRETPLTVCNPLSLTRKSSCMNNYRSLCMDEFKATKTIRKKDFYDRERHKEVLLDIEDQRTVSLRKLNLKKNRDKVRTSAAYNNLLAQYKRDDATEETLESIVCEINEMIVSVSPADKSKLLSIACKCSVELKKMKKDKSRWISSRHNPRVDTLFKQVTASIKYNTSVSKKRRLLSGSDSDSEGNDVYWDERLRNLLQEESTERSITPSTPAAVSDYSELHCGDVSLMSSQVSFSSEPSQSFFLPKPPQKQLSDDCLRKLLST